MRAATLAALIVTVLGLAAAVPAAGSEPVVVDDFGDWNLTRLGAGALDLAAHPRRDGRSVRYRLPAGARQGPARWYLVHVHFRATLSRHTKSGLVYVTASTDGRAGHMVTLRIRRRPGRQSRIAWTTLDLIRGGVRGVVRGRTVELDVENYVQNRGVRSLPRERGESRSTTRERARYLEPCIRQSS